MLELHVLRSGESVYIAIGPLRCPPLLPFNAFVSRICLQLHHAVNHNRLPGESEDCVCVACTYFYAAQRAVYCCAEVYWNAGWPTRQTGGSQWVQPVQRALMHADCSSVHR